MIFIDAYIFTAGGIRVDVFGMLPFSSIPYMHDTDYKIV